MLFEALKARAATLPPSAGLRRADSFCSYAEAVERVENAAAHLVAGGVEPGARVAVLLPASPELFLVSYALFAIGAVAVPLSLIASGPELAWAATATDPAAIVVGPGADVAAAALDPAGLLPRFAATAAGLFARIAPVNLAAPAADADAVFLFSSGSTGRPKVVPHTHAEMFAVGEAAARAMRLTPEDVLLNTLPGFHGFGFMSAQFEAVAGGATTQFWSDPRPMIMARAALLETLADRVTIMPGVPMVFDLLAGTAGDVDLSRLRLCYAGGVALRRPVFERFRERFGIAIRQAYGATETALMTMGIDVDADTAAWASAGPPLDGVVIEPVPHADAPEGSGELFIRTPSLARGYLGASAAAATATSFRDGGYLSGDLGHLDEAGNVYVTGRAKLIIEVAGHKVDPIEIEDVLAGHPGVVEAVVVAIPSPRTGEQELKAVVVRRDDVDARTLIALCRTSLSPHKVPARVEFRDEIPRSGAGKVLRGKLVD